MRHEFSICVLILVLLLCTHHDSRSNSWYVSTHLEINLVLVLYANNVQIIIFKKRISVTDPYCTAFTGSHWLSDLFFYQWTVSSHSREEVCVWQLSIKRQQSGSQTRRKKLLSLFLVYRLLIFSILCLLRLTWITLISWPSTSNTSSSSSSSYCRRIRPPHCLPFLTSLPLLSYGGRGEEGGKRREAVTSC